MFYQLTADLLVLIHLAFIVFVVVGGLLVLKRHYLAMVHIPAVVWGVVVETKGWLCPLTPWENSLSQLAGQAGYSGGYIEHYIIPLIYPVGLERDLQFVLGMGVLVINLCVYGFIVYRLISEKKP